MTKSGRNKPITIRTKTSSRCQAREKWEHPRHDWLKKGSEGFCSQSYWVSVKRGPDTCGWRMRMADADGKTRMEKCGWNKMRITKKVRRKKREMRMAKKNK